MQWETMGWRQSWGDSRLQELGHLDKVWDPYWAWRQVRIYERPGLLHFVRLQLWSPFGMCPKLHEGVHETWVEEKLRKRGPLLAGRPWALPSTTSWTCKAWRSPAMELPLDKRGWPLTLDKKDSLHLLIKGARPEATVEEKSHLDKR